MTLASYRRWGEGRWITFLVSIAGLVIPAACSDDSTGPEEEEQIAVDPPQGVTVSDAIGSVMGFSAPGQASGAQTSLAGRVVYVSAKPGTFEGAEQITIVHVATGTDDPRFLRRPRPIECGLVFSNLGFGVGILSRFGLRVPRRGLRALAFRRLLIGR